MTDQGNPVGNLNELEAINGEIWANVWLTSCVARIDPQSGAVKCGASYSITGHGIATIHYT